MSLLRSPMIAPSEGRSHLISLCHRYLFFQSISKLLRSLMLQRLSIAELSVFVETQMKCKNVALLCYSVAILRMSSGSMVLDSRDS